MDQRIANHRHLLNAPVRRGNGASPRDCSSASPLGLRTTAPDQHRAFEQRFGIGVIEAMGMTECASVVFYGPGMRVDANTARQASVRCGGARGRRRKR